MKKADLIIVAIVLAIAGILVFFLYFVNGESGKYVQVEVNGNVVETVSLNDDFKKTYDFDGETNTLVIEDGKANMVEANCPDGICVSHKPIYRSGESIICLPHKLVVTVIDDSGADDEVDAVA